MLKKCFSLLIMLIFLCTSVTSVVATQLPPFPKQVESKNTTAIVLLEKPVSTVDIQTISIKHPSLQLRKIYKHAIMGFSVKGKMEEIMQLKKEYAISAISEVSVYRVQADSSIPFIGADQARSFFDGKKQRITGKGVTVGIIDTGIDYTHPDLQKVYKGGRDLVDGDRDPMETKGQGDQSTIHGTHVAGIIAANGKMKGVAPEAEVIAYRALGPGGTGNTEQVLGAIEAAIEDKVDVLNLSLGNDVNGPDLPISIALNKAVESGIVAVTSNGNSGPAVWTVGSPGTAEKAISVGASTPPMIVPYMKVGLGARKKMIQLMPMQGSEPWELHFTQELMNGGKGREDDLKQVKGKVALIERGGISFTEKVINAKESGAVAVIIFNNTEGNFIGSVTKGLNIPVVSISKKSGEMAKRQIRSKQRSVQFIYKKEQDQLADFSSRGPVTVSWNIKPDLLAPGVAINSTIPSGYLEMQGTSMAAPHVSGASALILQAHPEWTPDQVKSALMSTSKPLLDKKGKLYRTFEQGAGRLQIDQALKADTLLYPSSLSFGMFTKKEGIHEHEEKLVIENTSKEKKNYSFQIPMKEMGITWDLPASFSVNPGEKKQVHLGLQINPTLMKRGIYDGFLTLVEGVKEISLPFLYVKEEPNYPRVMGFEFSAGDQEGMYRYEMYLPRGADEVGIALYDPDNFRFVGYLDWAKHVPQGLLKKELSKDKLPMVGIYTAIIFARKFGKEDQIETTIIIE
ncbi:S8 family serine peptidase [Peribacillus loiseleuriae]|uniref:S8 family serine peptidase n=1 Tax=Peribacillus loiseleuriae TaxID=1679170 RepID=UPI0037FD017B